jgi:phage tail-like protein
VDVNGTKFHLLYGCEDWGNCQLEDSEETLASLWQNNHASLEWDCESASLRLAREVPLFRSLKRRAFLDLSTRRGAGRDRYGNWYWIDPDESGIRFLPNGAYTSVQFWTATDTVAACVPPDAGTFAACLPPRPPTLLLRGLAVTTHHYLVVGDVTEHGLLIFDLHRGGPPLLQRWPDDVDFTPWDIAATPDGGVLVLDREHRIYWALDENFRLLADVVGEEEPLFESKKPGDAGGSRACARKELQPRGYLLTNGSPPGPSYPLSIEPGPDGNVLILETDPTLEISVAYSTIYEYKGSMQLAVYSLQDAVEVMDPDFGEGVSKQFSVVGHDFAYVAQSVDDVSGVSIQQRGCDCPDPNALVESPKEPTCRCQGKAVVAVPATRTRHLIYVADHGGKQAFAFEIDRANKELIDSRDFLPMRHWDGKAVVAADSLDGDNGQEKQVYYDFTGQQGRGEGGGGQGGPLDGLLERWVPLVVFTECHYAGLAVLTTPVNFIPDPSGKPPVPEAPFDSNIPACVWHRLFLDAQIPQGCEISVRARAADDPQLLLQTGWSQQPDPYLRSKSAGAEIPYYDPWADLQPVPDGTGTWELLFQEIRGRYLQIELTIRGTGRSTPALRALRAWYPRFSYLDHYLPALYREDPVPASFLDRWLANFEGFYTDLEDKIEHAASLFDPRTAPVDTLDWLACWMGLVLDPLWLEEQRRFLIRHVDQLYRLRGTVPGIEIAVRLYVDKQLDDSLFDLRCLGTTKVRIVERFLTRGVGGLAYGDPTDTGENQGVRQLLPLTPQIVAANAHRFTVLVPHELDDKDLAMVRRIVELEKPAHTGFELKRYWDLFRVGEARLGLDTRLGESSQFIPLLLGSAYLADNYLEAPYPFDIADRMVLDRDRLGNLPRL